MANSYIDGKLRSRLAAVLRLAILLTGAILISSPASAQEQATSGTLPADQLIDLLRQNPGALGEVKSTAAKYLQSQGHPVQIQDISDEVLFSRIEQDAELRARLTEVAAARGLISTAAEAAAPLPVRTTPTAQPRTSQPIGGQQVRASGNPRQSPYGDLPSLRDLYNQVAPQGGDLPRFGLDIFRRGTGNLDSLPADLPVGPDYVLGPGDGVNIDLWGSVSQRVTRTVDREGRVNLPEAGTVVVAGQTLASAQDIILKALSPQFRNLKVDVSLTRLRTVRVYVVGDVQHPGAYDISSLSTPLNALYAAGGPTDRGSLRAVRHYRGKELVSEVDLYELLLKGVRSGTARLEAGDTIMVPPVGPQVTIAGMVRRPATYEFKTEKTLAEALELAGGVLVSATFQQLTVDRIEAHQRRTMLSLNLPKAADSNAIQAALKGFEIQDGDQVAISSILPYSEQTVYLEGHVFRPGRYPYRDGMQIRDLLPSYQQLLPEPANHAELIRLVAPDYRPETIEFDLAKLLRGDISIRLQPFDTVHIFGRYEIDTPQVEIYGEILRPGKYPLSSGMTAAELIKMAGGFKRSAMKHTIDIASYQVQDGTKVELSHRTVDTAKAASGDGRGDLVLKPGDILNVRALTGWSDIGGAVSVSGEVNFPGTYGIHKGERLSSLIRRAGGFRPTAYPAAAILERGEVRALAEKSRAELIRRIEATAATSKVSATADPKDQAELMQAMSQQQQQILASLRSQPASARLSIQISSDMSQWENTDADVELRAGDSLAIPQRPEFVMISGQVYSPSAISYTPGRSAGSYLRAAGGTTDMANKKAMFIVRVNGSVLAPKGKGWFSGNLLSVPLQPGDTIVVPEKIVGGNTIWRDLLTFAQIASGTAIAARVATSF